MPLMQLKRLVLPAPFGPINASSSPASARNEMSRRTRSPPNPSDRLSTSSSAIMALRQAMRTCVAIAAPRAGATAEVELLNPRIGSHARTIAVHRDLAVFEYIGAICNLQRNAGVLLDNQQR